MSHRLEVLAGPGTVLRHGDVAVWAGPTASPALISFLVQSARNVGDSTRGGLQIVDHIAGILSTRDPEPGAPFAVIGPSATAWVTLLHGPVQLWDGARWLAPTPDRGWLRSDVTPQPAVSIGPAGGASPRLSPDSPYDLRAGTVPGGGLILVADGSAPGRVSSPVHPPTGSSASSEAGPPVTGPRAAGSSTTEHSENAPGLAHPTSPGPRPADPVPVPWEGPQTRASEAGAAPSTDPGTPPGATAWTSLRAVAAPPRPALPVGGAATPPGRPQVAGVRCLDGHLNHPAASTCVWCARPITAGQATTVGPRPVLGVLLAADDGETFRVDVDQVLGSNPTTDQGVAAGRLRGVFLTGAPGQLAPAHAEIRLQDWSPTVIDRGSAAGTFVVAAGTTGWVRLTPYQPVTLLPGSHVSVGQRVLTYLSPWPG